MARVHSWEREPELPPDIDSNDSRPWFQLPSDVEMEPDPVTPPVRRKRPSEMSAADLVSEAKRLKTMETELIKRDRAVTKRERQTSIRENALQKKEAAVEKRVARAVPDASEQIALKR